MSTKRTLYNGFTSARNSPLRSFKEKAEDSANEVKTLKDSRDIRK
jgi:hypothetical protein